MIHVDACSSQPRRLTNAKQGKTALGQSFASGAPLSDWITSFNRLRNKGDAPYPEHLPSAWLWCRVRSQHWPRGLRHRPSGNCRCSTIGPGSRSTCPHAAAFCTICPSDQRHMLHHEFIGSVQMALNRSGVHLAVDCRMGAMTGHALRRFQRQHNWRVTGRPDRETVKALGIQCRGLPKPTAAAGSHSSRLPLAACRQLCGSSACHYISNQVSYDHRSDGWACMKAPSFCRALILCGQSPASPLSLCRSS